MKLDELKEFAVALLAEGVDRNFADDELLNRALSSPSSRRAWIEMFLTFRVLVL